METVASLINEAWSFEHTLNPPLTEGFIWNMVQIGPAVSEVIKDFMILYMYTTQWQQ